MAPENVNRTKWNKDQNTHKHKHARTNKNKRIIQLKFMTPHELMIKTTKNSK